MPPYSFSPTARAYSSTPETAGNLPPRGTPPKPDASRTPGEWIAHYIRHMLAHDPTATLDYAYLTHFHDDHMGSPARAIKTAPGGYKLSGITEVGTLIPIKVMLDRGWPDYNHPAPLTDVTVANYRAFLEYQRKNNGMQVERLQPGRGNQIVLRRDAAKYPNFEVRNIASNGEVWTGVAETPAPTIPASPTSSQASSPRRTCAPT